MSSITARFIIQIAGKPVEKVEEALAFVEKKLLEEETKFKVLESEIEDPEFDEDSKLFGGFLEVTVRFLTVNEILNFIMDYTPTSVEVEDPSNIKLDNFALTSILNDMTHILINTQNQLRMANATIITMKKELDELKGVQE